MILLPKSAILVLIPVKELTALVDKFAKPAPNVLAIRVDTLVTLFKTLPANELLIALATLSAFALIALNGAVAFDAKPLNMLPQLALICDVAVLPSDVAKPLKAFLTLSLALTAPMAIALKPALNGAGNRAANVSVELARFSNVRAIFWPVRDAILDNS